MARALYREYRPKSLSEVVGQEHITTALRNALKNGKISHAYLFTGPRGVGKTSVARILAHEVNGFTYDENSAHLDIIEIDAASNRRIEEIRDLRDKVHVTPTNAKYKVYIIDEVHMLTREAFNALLKTLEEPPAHVIFILATTEAHKLPETIISRCMRFNFRPIEKSEVVMHLRDIVKKEGLKADDDALELIAEHGEGSFRDSIGLLDQASNLDSTITLDDVRQMLGIAPKEAIEQLMNNLANGTPKQLLDALGELQQRGFHAPAVAKQLSEQFRQSLLQGHTLLPADQLIPLMQQLLGVAPSVDPEVMLELVLLGVVLQHDQTPPAAQPTSQTQTVPESAPKMEPLQAEQPIPEPEPAKAEQPAADPEPVAEAKPAKAAAPSQAIAHNLEELWNGILANLKQSYNTLYGIARMAQPSLEDDTLRLGFRFPFHQKRVNEAKNRTIILDLASQLSGKNLKLECIVQKDAKPLAQQPPAPASKNETPKTEAPNSIETISNIFGGAELLDS